MMSELEGDTVFVVAGQIGDYRFESLKRMYTFYLLVCVDEDMGVRYRSRLPMKAFRDQYTTSLTGLIALATVGYGDISPSTSRRGWTMVIMIINGVTLHLG